MKNKRPVYVQSTHIISPLGTDTAMNFYNAKRGKTGVRKVTDEKWAMQPFYAAVLHWEDFDDAHSGLRSYPKIERLFIASVDRCLQETPVPVNLKKTLLILSSTKGSIDAVKDGQSAPREAFLHVTAKNVAHHFGLTRTPVVVSNACISGVLAINMAARLIGNGKIDQAIVSGGDLVTDFVVSGFNSLMAIDSGLCKPFDANRNGINLGEACGTILLGIDRPENAIEVLPGFTSNDANHISGPSRTGDGLLNAVEKTLSAYGKQPAGIDYISAHGTATLFNDDMESRAFHRAGLAAVPLNSLKGYFGHTLGAAGLVESIVAMESMQCGTLLKNMGYTTAGTAETLNILTENRKVPVRSVLKTASGFGGCNAAVLFHKENA